MPSISEIDNEPHSVRDVLQAVCNPIAESEEAQFNELTDKLAEHLMPSRDLIFLTHYFVNHWLPRLGPGPGWFATLMRDRCYLNRRTGEIRDEVRLEQGYGEAARWLGLKRVKTIWEWLRSADVALFLREMSREIGTWEEAPRRIKVCLGEPMTDEDQDQANALLAKSPLGASVTHSNPENIEPIGAGVTHSDAKDESAVGASCTRGDQQIGTSDSHSGASVTHSDANDESAVGASCTRGNQHIGASVTHNGATGTIDWRDWHSLISLTPGFKHLDNTQTTSSANDSFLPDGASLEIKNEVVAVEWKLPDLLTLNRLSAKNQELLLGKSIRAQTFISWLLYAASRSGNGIRDPIGHAISRLIEDPSRGAGGAYERLAGLSANELTELIQRELNRQSPWNTDWRTAMEGAPRTRLRALADQLGVPVPNSNDW